MDADRSLSQGIRNAEAINLDLERRVNGQCRAGATARAGAGRAHRGGARSLAKSRFFAAASHDLRSRCTRLVFAAALNQHATTQEARDLVARIGDSIVALESLFNELLDLSKLDAGAIGVHRRNVSLQELFDRLSGEFDAQAVEQELRMRFMPTKLLAYTDPILLERILVNLVSNALRYTARGGVISAPVGAANRYALKCGTAVSASPKIGNHRSSMSSIDGGIRAVIAGAAWGLGSRSSAV